MSGYVSVDPSQGVQLQGTSALQCAAGVIGSTTGQSFDTELYGAYIVANNPAATLTVAGLLDQTGSAQNLVIKGSISQDYFWMPPAALVNSRAAFTFTPSISGKVWLFARAYVGPESPR